MRRPFLRIALVIIGLAFVGSLRAEATGPDTLYSGNRLVRPARFHAILYFDARHGQSGNRNLILRVVQKFGEDLRRQDAADGNLPEDFRVATTYKELSDRKALDAYVNSLDPKIELGDVVFAWIECEGTKDNLELTGGRVSRSALATRLRFNDRPRLTVFITDACRLLPGNANAALPLVPEEGGRLNNIWRALYFGHRGMIDLRSASSSQAAFTLGARSVFATTFRNMFFVPNVIERIDPNGPKDMKFAQWDRFVCVLNEELAISSKNVQRKFINEDGTLTQEGALLSGIDVKLLQAGQTSQLQPTGFQVGAF